MTEQPAGWYPDPFAAVPGASRYWDGQRWTSHAQAPTIEPQPVQPGDAQGFASRGQGQGMPSWGAGQPIGHPEQRPFAGGDRSGQPAGWGARVGAYLLDVIPVVVVTVVLLWITGVYDAMNAAIASGDAAAIDAATAMMSVTHPAGLTITIANLSFVAAYNIGFHVSRGQTPGKMLVGIRVRRFDEDRNPDLKAASLRWLVQFGPSMIGGLPLIGFISSVFSIVDHLWPLWDRQRQAIHDKVGRTLVVRAR